MGEIFDRDGNGTIDTDEFVYGFALLLILAQSKQQVCARCTTSCPARSGLPRPDARECVEAPRPRPRAHPAPAPLRPLFLARGDVWRPAPACMHARRYALWCVVLGARAEWSRSASQADSRANREAVARKMVRPSPRVRSLSAGAHMRLSGVGVGCVTICH